MINICNNAMCDVRLSMLGVYLTFKYKTRPELRNASPEMRPFSDMEDAPFPSHFHLLFSLLLTFVAAIPNHTIRYTALGLLFVLAVLCTVHLWPPSTQLCHLAHLINQTEDLIRRAMAQCPWDHFSLTEEMGQLLE
jgi:hypothetical protein